MRRQQGVTFKDLLGALAVMALLAWFFVFFIGVPIVPIAKTRQVACASNEKQIGLAILQYAQDNNQVPPSGQHYTGIGWAGQIYPYVKSTGVFICPVDASRQKGTISYGYNSSLAALGRNKKWSLGEIASPQSTVMAFEISHDQAAVTVPDEDASHGATTFSAAGNGLPGGLHSKLSGLDPVQYARARHNPISSNYLFADGHVRVILFRSLSGQPPQNHQVNYRVTP